MHKLAGFHIRYLELDQLSMAPLKRGLPVHAVVFPRYEAGAALDPHEMTAAEAFAGLCRARSLIDRQPEVFREILRWVESVPAYRLAYGDLDRAIEWVLSLLGRK